MALVNLRNFELTLMDVLSILGSGVFALSVWYGLSGEVNLNKTEIDHLKVNVSRIERQAGEANDKILDQLKETNREMKIIRAESAAERTKILDKLDRIIERELDK